MAWTLAGRYRLTSSVARGPTGEVWRAVDEGTDRPVAVKVLQRTLTADSRLADRLLRARRALTALWHPSIARLLDVVVADRVVGLVTDYVPGTDLAQQMSAGPLAPARAAQVAAALADALATAHRAGVVHGDLKPSNVILPPDTPAAAVLTDFSVATLVYPRRPDQLASPYIPPWLVDSRMPTSSCDVYALGVVLREMLTGTAAGDLAGTPAELQEVVERCVHMERQLSAEQVSHRLRELAPLLRGRPAATPVRRSTPGASRGRRRPRARVMLGSTAAAVVATAIAAVAIGMLTRAEPTAPAPAQTTTVAMPDQAPTPPGGAVAPTQDGGAEFLEFWFAALSYAVRTGDTATLADATSPDCQDCQQAADMIESTYASGGSLRGGGYVVRGVSTTDFWSPERSVYDVTVDRSPRTTVDAGGAAQTSLPALSFANCVLVLEWADEQWRVREVVTPDCVM